jgi:hypothetical protein
MIYDLRITIYDLDCDDLRITIGILDLLFENFELVYKVFYLNRNSMSGSQGTLHYLAPSKSPPVGETLASPALIFLSPPYRGGFRWG